MNMNFGERQTRRIGVHFHEDERARRAEKKMNEAIQESLGDISYVQGVKGAVDTIAQMLAHCSVQLNDWPQEYLAPWLAHVVATKGGCDCDISTDYDGGHDIDFCPTYKDKNYRRRWYLVYFGRTEEEQQAIELEEQRKRAEAAALREAEEKERRRQHLLKLAEEFNVDPKYLP